jgi:hypothetical protein
LKDTEVKLGRDGKPSPAKAQAAATPEVRITVDTRAQNKAIRRTNYIQPRRSKNSFCEANGFKLFSKLDIIKAFHQFMLEKSKRRHTVITTHEGLLRYTRLHMRISCASEQFSENIRRSSRRRNWSTLEKCEFNKEEVKFDGLRFTKDGVSPTEERVKTLKECATPTDVKSLRSFSARLYGVPGS